MQNVECRSQQPSRFEHHLRETAAQVNQILTEMATSLPMSVEMRELVDYTLGGAGKRIRAVMILWIERMLTGQTGPAAQAAACAMEMVHTYSLVHDDLPAMDDDDLRRGRPTCHKAFDEASAILAGDALLTLAFEVLSTRVEDAALAVALIRELAQAAGANGMIAGQMADLKAENQPGTTVELEFIHLHKTARMFEAAARMGALCGGATETQLESLGQYGRKIGLGFQISDDLLDVQATTEQLGKTAGKDEQAGKLTYPAMVGVSGARQRIESLTYEARTTLAPWGAAADDLTELAQVLMSRKR